MMFKDKPDEEKTGFFENFRIRYGSDSNFRSTVRKGALAIATVAVTAGVFGVNWYKTNIQKNVASNKAETIAVEKQNSEVATATEKWRKPTSIDDLESAENTFAKYNMTPQKDSVNKVTKLYKTYMSELIKAQKFEGNEQYDSALHILNRKSTLDNYDNIIEMSLSTAKDRIYKGGVEKLPTVEKIMRANIEDKIKSREELALSQEENKQLKRKNRKQSKQISYDDKTCDGDIHVRAQVINKNLDDGRSKSTTLKIVDLGRPIRGNRYDSDCGEYESTEFFINSLKISGLTPESVFKNFKYTRFKTSMITNDEDKEVGIRVEYGNNSKTLNGDMYVRLFNDFHEEMTDYEKANEKVRK